MGSRKPLSCYGVPQPKEQRCAGEHIPRHRHHVGHITIVLAGRYREDGDEGRLALEPGHIVVHRPFEAHSNLIGAAGCSLMTFEAPARLPSGALFRHGDPDAVMRAAEHDPTEALAILMDGLVAEEVGVGDWPDMLAQWLRDNPRGRIGDWATGHGLARETISRGFRQAFGIPASQYRMEARARAAMAMICGSREPLSRVAAEYDLSDQPHLVRSIRGMTGRTPGEWRRMSQSFKTAAATRS